MRIGCEFEDLETGADLDLDSQLSYGVIPGNPYDLNIGHVSCSSGDARTRPQARSREG